MTLAELNTGEEGVIIKVRGRGAFRRRITEMGFVRGKNVINIKNAPLKDPIEFRLMNYDISLRRSEAALIDIATRSEIESIEDKPVASTIDEQTLKISASEKGKNINIALVGNPNAGKTTIFNFASNSKERVGNYSGVTVDKKTAIFKHSSYKFHITDLPGTYSISAYTPEELYVRNFIIDNTPDVVVNIVDASNIERNLFLTTQLIDMDIKVVMALNMYDELENKNHVLDYRALGKMLGIPIIPTVGSKGRGINELFEKIISVYNDQDPTVRHIHINYGEDIEHSIKKLQKVICSDTSLEPTKRISPRFLSLKLLEKDHHARDLLVSASNFEEIKSKAKNEINRLESQLNEDSETLITDAKYGFISGGLRETFKEGNATKRDATEIIDAFITHKLYGFPIFIAFLWLMFQSTFTLGAHPQAWIESGITLFGNFISNNFPEGPLKDLIINGIIGGVGGVIVFLPNIVILFMFISFMEDTGYMARAAFIMDKLMHKIGLHGKSFIPLIMGFGCNVPAIMATRTIENRNNRLLTMLINPFISCSARLPVHLLLIGTFFSNHKGSMLFLVYAIGILVAIGVALIFKRFVFTSDDVPFVMELPPYRIPTFRTTVKHMWNKASEYLKKMGGVILVASIIIWALGVYPKNMELSKDYHTEITTVQNSVSLSETEKEIKTHRLRQEQTAEQLEKSYIGKIGKWIEPVVKPLGFEWHMATSLVAGIAAKEIVVSTMGVVFQAGATDMETHSLSGKLRSITYTSGEKAGEPIFTPLVAFSFILFILLYFPCVAVIAAIKKESGTWKWAVFTIFYTTAIAWIFSFVVYQTGSFIIQIIGG